MKIRLGVFFGGKSVEHEISIISAIQAIESMDKDKYDIFPIYITKENIMYAGENIGNIDSYKDIPELLKNSKKIILVKNGDHVDLVTYPAKKFRKNIYAHIDVAFPIVHGTNVEDGTIQGMLKMLDIPYVGCDLTSSAIGMDKYIMKTVLKENGIPVLEAITCHNKQYIEDKNTIMAQIEETFQYPVIIKPINLGSSVGIKIARNRVALEEALEYAFTFSSKVLVERAVVNIKEINVSVLGDYEEARASVCERPINKDEILSYEDKYLSGGSKKYDADTNQEKANAGMASLDREIPAKISEEMKLKIENLAIKTFKVLNCNGVSRIDLIIDEDIGEVFVNEINTIPGSLSFYLWEPAGIKYKELLDEMINLAFKRKREEEEITFSFDTNILQNAKIGGKKGK